MDKAHYTITDEGEEVTDCSPEEPNIKNKRHVCKKHYKRGTDDMLNEGFKGFPRVEICETGRPDLKKMKKLEDIVSSRIG
ncbi:hypothetical protein KY345_02040 [Candidatus Woesearchaeota archaeon]|nr:hypothetical protein [Candidatus Woesearchaeota archaeon]